MTTEPSIEETSFQTQKDVIEAARRRGLGRLLLLARENFFMRMERATADLFSSTSFRTTSTLLPFIDVEGTRSTEVARRLRVSKQAVGRSIKILLDEGLVEFVSDPDDGRAFLVRYTPAGIQRLLQTYEAIDRVEQEIANELGADRLRIAHDVLFEMAYGKSIESTEATEEASPQKRRKRSVSSGKSSRR